MADTIREGLLAELADTSAGGPEWETLAKEAPELAAEVELTRKVRLLMGALHDAEIAVPEGFEARLMERLQEDRTLIEFVDLWVSGIGRALLELITILFSIAPQPTTPIPIQPM